MPRLLMDLKHATFEPCYKLRFEDKRTRLTVTAKQLRRWLHLPVHRNSEGRIAPRDVNMHTRQIDGDVIKMLLRLRKVLTSILGCRLALYLSSSVPFRYPCHIPLRRIRYGRSVSTGPYSVPCWHDIEYGTARKLTPFRSVPLHW